MSNRTNQSGGRGAQLGPLISPRPAHLAVPHAGRPGNAFAVSAGLAHPQRTNVRSQPQDDRDWCPHWIQKLVVEQSTVEDVVRASIRRVHAAPSAATILEAQTLINEFARDARQTAMLQRLITRKALLAVHVQGGEK